MRHSTPSIAVLLLSLLLPLQASAQHVHASHPVSAAEAQRSAVAATTARAVVMHRTQGCGCCLHWVEHMRAAGFDVEVRDHASLSGLKSSLGVPQDKRSCHTAQVAGYFIEGHVPAADIRRLLAEAPRARGLAVPGMPAGSPGMEMPDGSADAFTVELIAEDGASTEYARHAGKASASP